MDFIRQGAGGMAGLALNMDDIRTIAALYAPLDGIQNLKDAGCSQDTIECCLSCLDIGKKAELLKRLENHRKGLLHKVHEGEKQIDCLDYLIYQIDRCCSKTNR